MIRRYAIVSVFALLGIAALVWATLPAQVQAQLLPWPTPPPGPVGPLPEVIPSNEITPVPSPTALGGMAVQVDPLFAGPVPRDSRRPSIPVQSGEADPLDRVTLEFDAGSIARTVQLTYEPVPAVLAPAAAQGQRVLRAFRVSLYDAKGSQITPSFTFPVRLVVIPHADEVAASGDDRARLLLAQYDDKAQRWQPLVTTYRGATGDLMARIPQPGFFGLIADPAPVR